MTSRAKPPPYKSRWRYGAGEHALHGFVGQALGVGGPGHCHGFGAVDVAIDERRFDATRAIALHPAVRSEAITPQLLEGFKDYAYPKA